MVDYLAIANQVMRRKIEEAAPVRGSSAETPVRKEPNNPASTEIQPVASRSIVLAESKSGQVLAVVVLDSIEEIGTNLKRGSWLCLMPADGEWFWCHESRIIDRCPACPICGTRDRWEQIGRGIVCAECVKRGRP
jgi:hypothetical protein